MIVGSGFTGLSAALRLADAGRTVAVIDSGDIAAGASSMNAGMVSPDVKAGIDTVHGLFGPKVAREMWGSTLRAVELVKDLDRRTGAGSVTHVNGIAVLGRGSRALKAFDRDVAWHKERFGVEWEVVDARDIGSIVGGDHFNVALFQPEGFGVHPARLAFALASEARKAGAILVDHCAAVGIERKGPRPVLDTTKGPIRAGEIILATNGYLTRQPSRELARLIVPVGSYAIVTEPLGERVSRVFPGGSMGYTRKRLLNYMRLTHDNRVLFGGRLDLKTDLDLTESATDLRASLLEIWPELEDVEVSHVWGGKLGLPFDLIPHIGRLDGAWYAGGYGGHGVALSSQLGYELAGMILGDDPPSVYSQIPHNGRIYYSGRTPWFLTPASMLYKTLDKVGL